jgi:uncharacterized protein (TIGR03435 family)
MSYMKILFAVIATLALQSLALAQSRFDVAAIHPNVDRGRQPSLIVNPGGIIFTHVTLHECIEAAYGVKPYQVSGLDSIKERFDITAKAEGNHSKDELMEMLQTLLAERFKLAFHRERKELPVYVLETGKNGPKLHASDGEGDFSIGQAAGGIGFQKITMSDFAGMFLSRIPMIDRPVLDRTGLQGRYDFTLQLSPAANTDFAAIKRAAAEEGFSLFVYALDQLGLRLEAQKTMIEMIVIDHVERPSEN